MNYIGLPNNYLREEARMKKPEKKDFREEFSSGAHVYVHELYDATKEYLKHLSSLPVIKALFEVEVDRVYREGIDIELLDCEACDGDGKETCNNPDHGFISAVGGDIGRIGCPVCGHDEKHKVINGGPCEACNGTGAVAIKKEVKDNEASTNKPGKEIRTAKEILEKHQCYPSTLKETHLLDGNPKTLLERISSSMEEYASQFRDKEVMEPAVEREEVTAGDMAISILKDLCQMKHHKDTIGKDYLYEREQPLLWQRANKFINSIATPQPSSSAENSPCK